MLGACNVAWFCLLSVCISVFSCSQDIKHDDVFCWAHQVESYVAILGACTPCNYLELTSMRLLAWHRWPGGGVGGLEQGTRDQSTALLTRSQKSMTCLMTALMCSFSAQMNTKPTGHSLGRGRAARRGPGSVSDQLDCTPLQPEIIAKKYKEIQGGNSVYIVGFEANAFIYACKPR